MTKCLSDFEEVLKLEPGNKQALNELQKLQVVHFQQCVCIATDAVR